MRISGWSVIAPCLFLAAACGGDDGAGERMGDGSEAAPMPVEQMQGMQEMPRMGGMASGPMMDRMRGHMSAMQGVSADSVAAMMPMHRQMLANMIAQMNREMRDMNMNADSRWDATVDSLRSDLRRMPEMTPAEMRAVMQPHHRRIDRLIEMHRSMMESMPM